MPKSTKLPESDSARIVQIYEASSNRIEDLSSETLVKSIEGRLYDEFCLNSENGEYRDYDGRDFIIWVDGETHYAMEEKGFFGMEGVEDKNYDQTRDEVLVGVTERAIDFFRDCEEYREPREGNRDNLRCSLKDYMPIQPALID
jgi:hypothetical protein